MVVSLLQLLYMLMMVNLPHPPLSCITVTLLDGNSSCFQVLDLMDALMSVTVLEGLSELRCVEG